MGETVRLSREQLETVCLGPRARGLTSVADAWPRR